MRAMRGPLLSPRSNRLEEPEAIGSPELERLMMLELASTLEEWPARNIVVRERLDLAAREIVRLASVRSGRAASFVWPDARPCEPQADYF